MVMSLEFGSPEELVSAVMQQIQSLADAIRMEQQTKTPLSARITQTHCEVLLGLLNEYVGGSLRPYPIIRREGDA